MRIKTMAGGGCLMILAAVLMSTACSSDDKKNVGGAGEAGEAGSSAGEAGASSAGASGSSDGGAAGATADKGALIHVTATSQVGVLLDEIPEAIRERVAKALIAKPDSFYEARAKRQLTLATYRLNFRPSFYDEADKKHQLPLPPEEVLGITFVKTKAGAVAHRATVEGHDYVLADYELDATVVTDLDSPGISEPALADIGGTWDEPFVFPVDPELLVQRTGYACMDEAEFPPNSVDTEDVEFFYDQECDVEDELTNTGCHLTKLPDMSCADALTAKVGSVDMPLHFERIPWDDDKADTSRVGKVETDTGADLSVVGDELLVNRLTYRYITPDACSLAESCVGGKGWRRLLQFNASEKNVGVEPVNIGDVNYFLDTGADTPNANHHVYEYSECHKHYHFNHFATFTYGGDPDLGSKRAFCLESVARYSNHEQSPTWSPYNDCAFQGITQGWGDQYNAGIECQWVDVTTVDTSKGPVTEPLGLQSNPDGFLCEGTPVLDKAGDPVWEATKFKTEKGETVDRPKCEFSKNSDANNLQKRDVTLPVVGEGMITEPCTRGQIGPKRNCGYGYEGTLKSCKPGSTVALTCTIKAGSAPQELRVCEGSVALGAGVACVDGDALATASLTAGASVPVTFTCPAARDATEIGGEYAFYSGASWPEDVVAAVTCVAD